MTPAGGRPGDADLGDEDLARFAAAAATAVPGVIRLQPGLRHLAGRAARALFTGEGAHDDDADLSGIGVDRSPDLHVTLRIVVAPAPPPRRTAEQVHTAVAKALSQVTGPGLTVTVVVVDVEQ